MVTRTPSRRVDASRTSAVGASAAPRTTTARASEEIAAALGYGSLIGAFLTMGFCFLFRRATAGLKIFPDEKELDFDAI